MKKIIAMLTAFAIIGTSNLLLPEFNVIAETVTENSTDTEQQPDFIYTVKEDGTAEISEWCSTESSAYIPYTVDGYIVTSIGEFAFYGCENLRSVYIPSTVTSIGDGAFLNCENVDSVIIPDTVTSIGELSFGGIYDETEENFYGVEDFVVYGYDDGIAKSYADSLGFEYKDVDTLIRYSEYNNEITIDGVDSRIHKIDIPESIEGMPVVKIQSYAFQDNYYLESINLPSTLRSIEVASFKGCYSLTYIEIPDSVTEINVKAFEDCISLENIKLSANLETIGASAFSNCMFLTDVVLPEKLKTIDERAFEKCFSLTEITIPASVESLGEAVFNICLSLESINVSPENTYYYSKDGILFTVTHWVGADDTVTLISYPCSHSGNSYTIPEEVNKIDSYAFNYCQNLESVVITENVQQIGSFAFANSESLKYVEHPATAWVIGSGNYRDCPNLTVVAEKSDSFDSFAEKEENENKANFKVLGEFSFDILKFKRNCLNETSENSTVFDVVRAKNSALK